MAGGVARYALANSSSASRVALATLDGWGAAAPDANEQQLAEYEGLVSLPFDALGDPGWNLQVGQPGWRQHRGRLSMPGTMLAPCTCHEDSKPGSTLAVAAD